MTVDEIVTAGALALYKTENAHRVEEFAKADNAEAAIAADFELFRGRYTRKFQDFSATLAAQGLAITRAA